MRFFIVLMGYFIATTINPEYRFGDFDAMALFLALLCDFVVTNRRIQHYKRMEEKK